MQTKYNYWVKKTPTKHQWMLKLWGKVVGEQDISICQSITPQKTAKGKQNLLLQWRGLEIIQLSTSSGTTWHSGPPDMLHMKLRVSPMTSSCQKCFKWNLLKPLDLSSNLQKIQGREQIYDTIIKQSDKSKTWDTPQETSSVSLKIQCH